VKPYLVRVVADPAVPTKAVVFTQEADLSQLRAKLAEMTANGAPGGHPKACACRLCSIRGQIAGATREAARRWPPGTRVRLDVPTSEMAPRIVEMQRWLDAQGFADPRRSIVDSADFCSRRMVDAIVTGAR